MLASSWVVCKGWGLLDSRVRRWDSRRGDGGSLYQLISWFSELRQDYVVCQSLHDSKSYY